MATGETGAAEVAHATDPIIIRTACAEVERAQLFSSGGVLTCAVREVAVAAGKCQVCVPLLGDIQDVCQVRAVVEWSSENESAPPPLVEELTVQTEYIPIKQIIDGCTPAKKLHDELMAKLREIVELKHDFESSETRKAALAQLAQRQLSQTVHEKQQPYEKKCKHQKLFSE